MNNISLIFQSLRRRCVAAGLAVGSATMGLCAPTMVHAHPNQPSEASALSGVAVGLSVAAPSVALMGATSMMVAVVTVAADGTVWVLERASDGARFVVKVSTTAAGVASVAVGTAVTVTAISTGWVLSVAGQVIAFVPNTLGHALLHHETVLK